MNNYGDVNTLISQSYINLTGTDEFIRLRRIMEGFSDLMDRLAERRFYCYEGAYYFDGPEGIFWVDDLLSISEFLIDEDGDGTPESSLVATDYLLKPYNKYPKDTIEPSPWGNYGSFAAGIAQGVKITGVWGYGNGLSATPYKASGDTVQDDPLIAGATLILVTDPANFSIGQNLRIETEQVYIEDITIVDKQLKVERGINGTTAAEHAKDTAISIYEYPFLISQAVYVETARTWKRKDEGWVTAIIGSKETGGPIKVSEKGLDKTTEDTIERFKRHV